MTTECQSVELATLLQNAQLPALPQSAIKLLELSQDPENGPIEFAQPIEADPGLTGQVLRFVNSSYFGFSNEISSVRLAITLVGIRTIKNFSLWSAVFSLMPNPKCGPFDLKKLWLDSLRRALFARAYAKRLGQKEAEDAFAAGLLQDMAVPLLAKELPAAYTELLGLRQGGAQRLSQLEKERFGWTHGEAASVMARQWKLPQEFADAIAAHADPQSLHLDPRREPIKLAVAISSLLPSATNEQWTDRIQFEEAFAAGCPEEGAVEEILERVDQQFLEFGPILKIATPARTLLDWYRELAPVI